jgi:nucleotide-binding universal stress UspA family protein
MKTILVPTFSHDGMRATLATALLLARRFDSYIEGFALRFSINEFVAVDMTGTIPLDSLREESFEEAKRARALFEGFMIENGVPRAGRTTDSLSFGWHHDAPEGEEFVGSHGRIFDIIVISRLDEHSAGLHGKAIESALFESGRPILVTPLTPPPHIATHVLVAWNRSTEQARATALGIPLLRAAERVTVLHVEGGAEVAGPTPEELLRYLHLNGIAASLGKIRLDGRSTGEAILAAAQEFDCDLLIKGAYTQSRLRQLIFGGATRHILANATLPVLMAN